MINSKYFAELQLYLCKKQLMFLSTTEMLGFASHFYQFSELHLRIGKKILHTFQVRSSVNPVRAIIHEIC